MLLVFTDTRVRELKYHFQLQTVIINSLVCCKLKFSVHEMYVCARDPYVAGVQRNVRMGADDRLFRACSNIGGVYNCGG